MKNFDEVIEMLTKDKNCSNYLMEYIVNKIEDIEQRGNSFNLIKLIDAYELEEYKDSVFIDSEIYSYSSFV